MLNTYNDNLFAGTNAAQIEAITHESGPVMCLAGPGSGKTFVLTRHIRYLIKEKHIEPHHIIVITFSKASAVEMQKRFITLMNDEYYPVRFGTFHSVFFHLLSKYEHYKISDILSNSQKKNYIKTILNQMDYSYKKDTESIENILSQISYIKNHTTESFPDIEKEIPHFKEIYQKYEKLTRLEHKLDFDDMMLLCHQMLKEKPDILEELKKEISHVLVDEYQDINPIQYELVKKLIYPHNNLFVVGDDDQSIYGFRGCNPKIMLTFQDDFPNGKIITFPINYRCSPSIVKAANAVISNNSKRYSKDIRSGKTVNNAVVFSAFENKETEYDKLISEFKEIMINNPKKMNCIACLFRTNLDASFMAERLLKEGIPYQMRERPYNVYEHFIAKDFIHYLFLKNGNLSIEHFVPVMNRPLRYINRDAINTYERNIDFKNLKDFYKDKEYMLQHINKMEYDLNRMQKMDIYAAINYLRKGMGYDDFLRKHAHECCIKPEEYLLLADELQTRMGEYTAIEELQLHIGNYKEQIINHPKNNSNKKEGLQIMTYHASKGLEFDNVYLPDCNEGIIPYRKSITNEEVEEERRLFYVAMTRAKDKLVIYYIDGDKNNKHLISRFVKEAKRL